jgi:malate synthase
MRMSQPTMPTRQPATSVVVDAPHEVEGGAHILSTDALAFLGELQTRFGGRRDELLEARRSRRAEVSRTGRLDFLDETREVREGDWTVAPAPADFADRRVEITGPTERKMAINALNSGAKVWLADLEDANTPHWDNVIGGQVSLFDAVRRTIELTTPQGKHYELKDPNGIPVIVPRPRGWHFDEEHLTLDGRPLVGALVDFGLYFFHNAAELIARGSGPYFYLPKMESHLEARLWNDVFTFAQEALGIPHGTIRATVLIETIPAAFEMDEILYELRDHAAGLNAGRWDYLFSIIKYFRDSGPSFTLPDRNAVTMNAPMMKAYSDLLVKTCHKRGAFAIGGMAAFIPSKDPSVNEAAFAKVRADKEREVGAGFDGSWVAHPGMVELCKEIFTGVLGDSPNQLAKQRDDVAVTGDDLLDAASTPGDRTLDGLRGNVSVGIQYLQAWLLGNGAVAIHNLMEDAATAEISRSQIWQWLNSGATLASGETVTRKLVDEVVEREYAALVQSVGDDETARGALETARRLFVECALDPEFPDFLTLPAYAEVLKAERD